MSKFSFPPIPPQTFEPTLMVFDYRGHEVQARLEVDISDRDGFCFWLGFVVDGDEDTSLLFYLDDKEADQYHRAEQAVLMEGKKPSAEFSSLVQLMLDRYLQHKAH